MRKETLDKIATKLNLNQRGNVCPMQGMGTSNFHLPGKFREWVLNNIPKFQLDPTEVLEVVTEANTMDCADLLEMFRLHMVAARDDEEEEEEESKWAEYVPPAQFVIEALKRNQFYLTKGRVWVARESDGITRQTTPARISVVLLSDLHVHNRSQKPTNRLGSEIIKIEFEKLEIDRERNRRIALAEDLRYEAAFAPGLDVWIDRLHSTMKIAEDIELFRVVFKHFMWQVKRRVFHGVEEVVVKNPLWLAIMGEQGIGKDYLLEHGVFKPFAGFYIMGTLALLDDFTREIEKFTSNYIINFNELVSSNEQKEDSGLERLSKGAIAALKMIITNDSYSIRAFGTQNQFVRKRIAENVSTCNFHLYDIIHDPSGMRRFFEVNSQVPKGGTFDHADVAWLGENAQAAWCGVDEENTEGYLIPSSPIGQQIRAIQGAYKGTTSIHHWMDECKIGIDENVETPVPAAYNKYCKWCSVSKINYVFTRPNFRKFLDINGWFDKTSDTCYLDLN